MEPARKPSGAARVCACTSTGGSGGGGGGGGGAIIGDIWAGSVGCIPCMCRPQCWQNAKPIGVAVLQRGHVIVGPPGGRAVGPPAPGFVDGIGYAGCDPIVGGSACGVGAAASAPPIGPLAMYGTPATGVPPGGGGGGGGICIAGADCMYGGGPGGAPRGPGGGMGMPGPDPMYGAGGPPIGGGGGGGDAAAVAGSALPHARQNFMPAGFSP